MRPLAVVGFVMGLAAPYESLAQTSPSSLPTSPPVAGAAYTGPRFPGGPDSLRALVYRSVRPAPVGTTGLMLVQVENRSTGKPPALKLLPPAEAGSPALKKASTMALDYLKQNLPAWLPGTAPGKGAQVNDYIPLLFGRTSATALPYAYADQSPRFDGLAQLAYSPTNPQYQALTSDPAKLAEFNTSQKGLEAAIQRQTRYPPAAMRAGEQGRVMLYLEVAENGAVEHAQIASNTAGLALADEVMRVARQLSPASSPAQLRGQPVRVYYVIPLTFKILQ